MSTEKIQLLEEFNQWVLFVQLLQQQNGEIWNMSLQDGKWTIQHLNFDEFNSKAKIYVKTISISELSEKAIFYREQISKQIKSLSDDEYMKTYIDGDGNPFNVTQYLKDFIWHDQHHINQMQNILGREVFS
jgi:hypothetical protein